MVQVATPHQQLHDLAVDAPLQWAPVLAMFIHNHQNHIPNTAYADWLQAAQGHVFEDVPEPAATLWLLRCLHEQAQAWPAALTAAEEDCDRAGETSASQLESCWKVHGLNLTHCGPTIGYCLGCPC